MTRLLESLVGAPFAVSELKHRPGRRLTLRASGTKRTAIVKLYASDRAPVVAERLAALASGPAEPKVPSVLYVNPELRLVVLSELQGEPFRLSILRGDLTDCARVGRAVARWHHLWRQGHETAFRPHTFADEQRILLAQAAAAPPPIAAAVRASLAALEGEWRCTTVVHRDLYEEQILLGERVGLIDLDDAALGPPELDVGNLLAHVELLALRAGGDFGDATAAFLDAYGALDRELLERCRRLATLRLACIHRLPALVERAASRDEVRA